jgi:hypothetical protein
MSARKNKKRPSVGTESKLQGIRKSPLKVKTPSKITGKKSAYKCEACSDTNWWCRGCGGYDKKLALEKAGFSEAKVESIYQTQFGSCSAKLVPCYLCNHRGTKKRHLRNQAHVATFWNDFK